MLDEYNKTPNPDPKVADFIRDSIEQIHSVEAPPAKLKADARLLADAHVEDALFNCLAADALGESRRDLYKKGMAWADKGPYNKFIFYMTAMGVNVDMDKRKAPKGTQEAQFKITLDLFRAAMQTEVFKPEEIVALQFRLDSTAGQLLFTKYGAEVCEILRSSKQVPPWLTEYYEGRREVNEAWNARGKGWASSVKPEGWKGFEEHLAEARAHLVKSWKLNPANPRAAARMITVVMGESESIDTLRLWFDRAVAAQMDCTQAYENMRWALAPRWGGSIEEMLAFGEECIRTKRYDTGVPYEYINAVMDASEDLGDKGAIFADPKINQNVLDVLTAYLSDPNTVNPPYKHALFAVVAYKGGKLDLAKQHLEKLDYTIKEGYDYLGKYVDVPAMIAELRAYKAK
jgi:hypothetical protein